MGRDQGGGLRDGDRRRRHDHPPPRGRPRPPALVRPPAPRAVRRGALRAAKRAVDPRASQPRRPDRPLTFSRMETLTEERPPAPRARRVARRAGRAVERRRRCSSRCGRRSGSRTCSCSPACCSRGSSTRAAQVVDAIAHLRRLLRDLERRLPVQRPSRRAARPPHPEKRHRPIASGELAAARRVGWPRPPWRRSRSGSRFGVSPEVAGLVALYGVITVAYSLVLKRLVIIDVMTIASLFILRVVAGAVAVEAHASEWLLLCTAMLALFLGFTKRRQEAMEETRPMDAATRGRGVAGDPAGARALLAAVPRPDGRDGDRRRRSSATRSTPSTAR